MTSGPMNGVVRHLRRAALLQDGGGMTDGQLLECFLVRREEAAFEALVRRHGPMVLGVCRRILRNAADADDAFQTTFLVLVRKAGALLGRETVGNWLYGVAYRTALKARAAAAKRRAKEARAGAMPRPEAPPGLDWDVRRLLDRELSRLPDRYREAVVLCDLQGKSRHEAALQLGIPEGTLSGRLTTARRLLAGRLTRRGVALSGGVLAAALAPGAASADVSVSLVISTAKAAALSAAAATAAGAIPARAAAAAGGGWTAMVTMRRLILAVAVLAAGAAGVGVGAFTRQPSAPRPTAAGPQHAPQALIRKADEPGKNGADAFKKLYALPKGEVLKRVAPPFPPGRMAYYRREHATQAKAIPAGPTAMFFRWRDGKLQNWGMHFGEEAGTDLTTLLRIIVGIYPQEVEEDPKLVNERIPGDFIVREGAPAEQVVRRLQEILQRECKLPVRLTFREVKRKVFVASGTYHFKPLPGRQENWIEIYGKQLVPNSGAGGGSGDFQEFLRWVGMFIGRRVVSDVASPPGGTLSWQYNRRSPFTEQEQKEDTDPALVLKHLTEQTGLTFQEEERPVRVLFVERAKEPAAGGQDKGHEPTRGGR